MKILALEMIVQNGPTRNYICTLRFCKKPELSDTEVEGCCRWKITIRFAWPIVMEWAFGRGEKVDRSNFCGARSASAFLLRPRDRSVDSRPSSRAVCSIQFADPMGFPRITQRQIVSSSASVCGRLTFSSHRRGRGNGRSLNYLRCSALPWTRRVPAKTQSANDSASGSWRIFAGCIRRESWRRSPPPLSSSDRRKWHDPSWKRIDQLIVCRHDLAVLLFRQGHVQAVVNTNSRLGCQGDR